MARQRVPSVSDLTHLQRLEAESIYIIREAVAECQRPVLLYSIGKDSSVLLHLALKAFHPAKPPIPLLHIDTTWKNSSCTSIGTGSTWASTRSITGRRFIPTR